MASLMGSGGGGGGLWHRPTMPAVRLSLQGAGRTMGMGRVPPSRVSGHLTSTDLTKPAELRPKLAVRLALQGAGRTMGRVPPSRLYGHHTTTNLAKPAELRPKPAVRLSLQGAGRTMDMGRVPSLYGHLSTTDLTKPTEMRAAPAVRLSLQGTGWTMGSMPQSRRSGHLATTAKPAAELRGSPGHLKGAALGRLHTCYAAKESSLNEPSPPADKLDLLLQIKEIHDNVQGMTAVKNWLKRTFILQMMLSVLVILLVNWMIYIMGRGRAYNKLIKLLKDIFFSFVKDAEVKQTIQELINGRVDATVYYVSSSKTWAKWWRYKWGGRSSP